MSLFRGLLPLVFCPLACSSFGTTITPADGGDGATDVADAGGTDADQGGDGDVGSSPRCTHDSAFGAAVPVGELNSDDDETSARLSANGLEVFVTRSVSGVGKIHYGSRADRVGTFGALAVLDLGPGEQRHATVSDNGLSLYVAVTNGNKTIARSVRTGEGTYTESQAVPLGVPGGHFEPYVAGDDLELFFVADSGSGNKIFAATRATSAVPFGPAVAIPSVDLSGDEGTPVVSADGVALYFTAEDGQSHDDIFIARRSKRGEPWGTPKRLDKLATSSDERPGFLTPDNCTLYFASDRPNAGKAQQNIWRAQRQP